MTDTRTPETDDASGADDGAASRAPSFVQVPDPVKMGAGSSERTLKWLARAIFVVGLLTLALDAPILRRRFERGLVPIEVLFPGRVEGFSSIVLLLIGIFLVILAGQIRRGKHRAWVVTSVLLGLAGVLHVLRGPHPVAATVSFALLALLLALRKEFTARSDPPSLLRLVRFIPTYLLLVLLYGVIALSFQSGRIDPEPDFADMVQAVLRGLLGLDPPFTYPNNFFGRAFPVSLAILGLVGFVTILVLLFRPIVQRPQHSETDWALARHLVHTYGDDTLSYFALRPDKSFFFSSDGKAMIAYGYMGGYALASGDPIGAPESIALVVDEFLRMCKDRAWGVAFLGARESDAALYEAHALRSYYMGDEAVIDTSAFSLEGRPIRKVRQSCNRLEKAGFTFEVVHACEVDAPMVKQLHAISEKWRGAAPERGYTMTMGGELLTHDERVLLAIARDGDGVPRGFYQLVPCFGERPGYSLDLMRRDPETPNGLVEYLTSMTVLDLKARGFYRLSLNFAVFARLMHDDREFTTWEKVQRFVVKRFNPYFQIESLYVSNRKYFPDFIPRVVYYDSRRNAPRIGLLYAAAEELVRVPFLGASLVPTAPDRRAGA